MKAILEILRISAAIFFVMILVVAINYFLGEQTPKEVQLESMPSSEVQRTETDQPLRLPETLEATPAFASEQDLSGIPLEH